MSTAWPLQRSNWELEQAEPLRAGAVWALGTSLLPFKALHASLDSHQANPPTQICPSLLLISLHVMLALSSSHSTPTSTPSLRASTAALVGPQSPGPHSCQPWRPTGIATSLTQTQHLDHAQLVGKWKFPHFWLYNALPRSQGQFTDVQILPRHWRLGLIDREMSRSTHQPWPLPPYLHSGVCPTSQLTSTPQKFFPSLNRPHLWTNWDLGIGELQCSSHSDLPRSFMEGTKKSHKVSSLHPPYYILQFSIPYISKDKLGREKSSMSVLSFKDNIPSCYPTHRLQHAQRPLPPFLVHTWSRPAEALSLFCRSRGSQGGYTTAAYRDQTYETETQKKISGWCFDGAPASNSKRSCSMGLDVPCLALKLCSLIPEEHCGISMSELAKIISDCEVRSCLQSME